MLLAVAAVKLQTRVETRSDLLAALQRSPALIRVLRPSDNETVAEQVSPDGRLLATGDSVGAVRFIDMGSWQVRGTVVRLPDSVAPFAMSFSLDGRALGVVTVGPARRAAVSDRRRLATSTSDSHLAWPGSRAADTFRGARLHP